MVAIVPYRAAWAEEFARIERQVSRALGSRAL
jgi:GrpB-like predicted nucleotidyltransferase (UPF0157 family)